MSFGAHWFSDVITSGFVVFVWTWLLGWLFYTRSPPWTSSEAIDTALFRTRAALGRELGYAWDVHVDAFRHAWRFIDRRLIDRLRRRS